MSHTLQGIQPKRVFIQAGDEVKAFSSGFKKAFFFSHADFLKCFEAVTDKRWADHEHALNPLLCKSSQLSICIRFYPWISTKP